MKKVSELASIVTTNKQKRYNMIQQSCGLIAYTRMVVMAICQHRVGFIDLDKVDELTAIIIRRLIAKGKYYGATPYNKAYLLEMLHHEGITTLDNYRILQFYHTANKNRVKVDKNEDSQHFVLIAKDVGLIDSNLTEVYKSFISWYKDAAEYYRNVKTPRFLLHGELRLSPLTDDSKVILISNLKEIGGTNG